MPDGLIFIFRSLYAPGSESSAVQSMLKAFPLKLDNWFRISGTRVMGGRSTINEELNR